MPRASTGLPHALSGDFHTTLANVVRRSPLGKVLLWLFLSLFLLSFSMVFIIAFLSERYSRVLSDTNVVELEAINSEQLGHMEKILAAHIHTKEVLKSASSDLESFREQTDLLFNEFHQYRVESEQLNRQHVEESMQCRNRVHELEKKYRTAQQEITRLRRQVSEKTNSACRTSSASNTGGGRPRSQLQRDRRNVGGEPASSSTTSSIPPGRSSPRFPSSSKSPIATTRRRTPSSNGHVAVGEDHALDKLKRRMDQRNKGRRKKGTLEVLRTLAVGAPIDGE